MDTPIPQRMRHLPRDRRGYPIPKSVLIDDEGRPHFTINDEAVRLKHMAEDRCPICGARLIGGRWFVGGPRSAFHPQGAYIDLPMHDECAHYALAVCPWLAAPNYTTRLDDKTLQRTKLPPVVMLDRTVNPERPVIFVAVLCRTHSMFGGYPRPDRPYMRVEYWRAGTQLDEETGKAIVATVLALPVPVPQPARLIIPARRGPSAREAANPPPRASTGVKS
jgi:hypothetical protein